MQNVKWEQGKAKGKTRIFILPFAFYILHFTLAFSITRFFNCLNREP